VSGYLQNYQTFPGAAEPKTAEAKIAQWLEYVARKTPDLEGFAKSLADSEAGRKLLYAVFGNSPYLTQLFIKNTRLIQSLLEKGFDETFAEFLAEVNHPRIFLHIEEIMAYLRQAKNECSLMVALADITENWSLEQITSALSSFAEITINKTVDFLLARAAGFGEIEVQDIEIPGRNSGLIILAMGKLGGRELNYSSDVDLIIFFDSEKVKYLGAHNIQHFFTRLAQDLTRIMQDRTEAGYVFRIDLRLRPDPASTPPAMSVRAAEIYYESVGQNWERAAMIKARAIAGDIQAGEKFLQYLRPYVWRKNLDFAAIEDIQSIKRQIDNKHKRVEENLLGYNIKLGHGGIREIEFFIQTQQLIWGGREMDLRIRATCEALEAFAKIKKIDEKTCKDLISAYRFYRKIEHRLQMVNDNQTHSLPADQEDFDKFAIFMGYENPEDFEKELFATLNKVQQYYAKLYAKSPSLASSDEEASGSLVFTGTEHDPETLETISGLGFKDPVIVSETIRGWHHGRRKVTSSKKARELLTELVPAILGALSKTINPDSAFAKFDEFLSRLPDGVQIFALFYSNPELLELIAEIMGRYPYLAEKLSRKPALLDYVLSPEFYLDMPDKEQLKAKLVENLHHARDYQDVLDITRRWTQDRQFRLGVQLLKNQITPEQAGLHLSNIADTVLSVLLKHTRKDFAEKHGKIPESQFAIVAMGKLGGAELTFGSDLDLVFIYHAKNDDAVSSGPSPLSVSEYFLRLSRRFIAAITALTPEGKLYEIDVRLRPSGQDGPVASSIKAFEIYYDESAWIWEYMALTRARVISGSGQLQKKIRRVILGVLRKPRDASELAKEIDEMREKIEKQHGTDNPFDVKYVRGGLIDVEFLIQYLELCHSGQYPELIQGNLHLAIEKIGEYGLLPADDVAALKNAAEILLNTQCILRLIGSEIPAEETMTPAMKKVLSTSLIPGAEKEPAGDEIKFENFKKMLVETQKNVQGIYRKVISKKYSGSV